MHVHFGHIGIFGRECVGDRGGGLGLDFGLHGGKFVRSGDAFFGQITRKKGDRVFIVPPVLFFVLGR